jgi:hypothetical protein
MPAWPDAPVVVQFLAQTSRRLLVAALLRGAAWGLIAGALLVVVAVLAGWPQGVIAAAIACRRRQASLRARDARTLASAAREVERRASAWLVYHRRADIRRPAGLRDASARVPRRRIAHRAIAGSGTCSIATDPTCSAAPSRCAPPR